MKYQKITNFLDNASNQSSKFRARNLVEINYSERGAYSHNEEIWFKTTMLRSSLCDYRDTYIHVKRNMSVNNTAGAGDVANNAN